MNSQMRTMLHTFLDQVPDMHMYGCGRKEREVS